MTYQPTTWAVTRVEHPITDKHDPCPECTALVDDAITTARFTGSTGATSEKDSTRVGGEFHSATVARVIQLRAA